MVAVTSILLAFTLLAQTDFDDRWADVRGPATICFRYSSFTLHHGERVEVDHVGIHGIEVSIEGPFGTYKVSESETQRTPSRLGTPVYRKGELYIFRSRERPPRYAFVTPTEFSPFEPRMIASISGDGLSGGRRDASIYRRLVVSDPLRKPCDHRYQYGFDAVLGIAR